MATKAGKAPTEKPPVTATEIVKKKLSEARRSGEDWARAKDAGVLEPLQQSTVATSTPSGTPSRVERFIEALLGEEAAIGTVSQDDADRMLDAVLQQSEIMGSDLTEEEQDHVAEQALEMWWMDNPDLIERNLVESGFDRQDAADAVDNLEDAADLDPSERKDAIVNLLIKQKEQAKETSGDILERLKEQDPGDIEIDI